MMFDINTPMLIVVLDIVCMGWCVPSSFWFGFFISATLEVNKSYLGEIRVLCFLNKIGGSKWNVYLSLCLQELSFKVTMKYSGTCPFFFKKREKEVERIYAFIHCVFPSLCIDSFLQTKETTSLFSLRSHCSSFSGLHLLTLLFAYEKWP